MEWILQFWESLTWSGIALGAFLIIISTVISYAVVVVVMVKLPADYFSPGYSSGYGKNKSFFVRWGTLIFKNLMGVLLIVVGFAMMLGPGPGLLTILLGLIMLDIPGKRPLEARIIKRPTILKALNKLRARYEKPPLILD